MWCLHNMASIMMLIVILTIVLQSSEGSPNGKDEHIEPGLMQERQGNGEIVWEARGGGNYCYRWHGCKSQKMDTV